MRVKWTWFRKAEILVKEQDLHAHGALQEFEDEAVWLTLLSGHSRARTAETWSDIYGRYAIA
jgi:hypothetical protein